MSKSNIWMPLYVADYLADTTRLTTEQHGAYLLLIMDYWRNGPLPDDDVALSQITRLHPEEWNKNRPMLVRMFRIEAGEWRHKRIDEEIIEAASNAKKYADRAKKAAAKRWENQPLRDASSNASSNQNELLEQCTSPSPVHHLKEPPIPPKGGNAGSKSQAIALKTYLAECKAKGEKAIPEDDPVFVFADKAGIPDEWLRIVWREFVERYSDGSKRYKDWRKHFRNAVRGNWFKVWYCDEGGRMCLSSQGRVLDIANLEAA